MSDDYTYVLNPKTMVYGQPAAPAAPGELGICYVAGPMRSYPYFNMAAFDAAEGRLRARGWGVINPVSTDIAYYGRAMFEENPLGDVELAKALHGFNIRWAMARNCENIALHADALYMLRGWQDSEGALTERSLGRMLNLEIMYESGWDS